jgi:glutathione S-transferase
MKLYYWPGACSLSPHIVSREAGIDLQLAQLDRAERKTADGTVLSSVNPKNQVPVLEMDDGQKLTEGPVIVQYLADLKPASGLVPPPGSPERYRVQEWLNFISSELHKTFSPLFRPTTPDDFKATLRDMLAQRFDWIDKELAGKPHLMGDIHGGALVAARRHRSRQVEKHYRLSRPCRCASESAGSHEGGRFAAVARDAWLRRGSTVWSRIACRDGRDKPGHDDALAPS